MVQLDHLSNSSVSQWLMCPRSWKFGRVDQVPHKTATNLVFGSAFHDAVEDRVRSNAIEPKRPLIKCWSAAWSNQLIENDNGANIEWGDKTASEMNYLGRSMLAAPSIRNMVDSIRPMMVVDERGWELADASCKRPHPLIEKLVELRIPGIDIPLIGYVDVITNDAIPGDLKTASRRWSQSKADKEMQATLYLAALEQMGFERNPKREFRYYVFTKTNKPAAQVITTTRTQKQIDWTLQAVRDVYDAIKKGVFPPNNTGWKCGDKWCEFYEHCHS